MSRELAVAVGLFGLLLLAGGGGALVSLDDDRNAALSPALPTKSPVNRTPSRPAILCDSKRPPISIEEHYEDEHNSQEIQVAKSFVAARYPESSLMNGIFSLENERESQRVVSTRVGDSTKATFQLERVKQYQWAVEKFEACQEVLEKEELGFAPLSSTKGAIATAISASESEPLSRIALIDEPSGAKLRELHALGGTVIPEAWSPSGHKLLYVHFPGASTHFRVASFAEGKDELIFALSGPTWSHPVWLGDGGVLAERDGILTIFTSGMEPKPLKGIRSLGVCPPDPGSKCPNVTGIGVEIGTERVAVTFSSGHLVFFPNGIGNSHTVLRSPDETECQGPYFRPRSNRLGVTCTFKPIDYAATSGDPRRDHYDMNAWVIDLGTGRWSKIRTEEGWHEGGAYFFPWTPDARHYLLTTYGLCSSSFRFVNTSQGTLGREYPESAFGSFSPDGKRFVFAAGRDVCGSYGSKIVVARIDGSGSKTLLGDALPPVWSPAL